MLLADPGPSSFDLNFRMLGTNVRVHPMFWLCSGLLGWSFFQSPVLPGNGITDLALWIGCCFASILLHEFGHVFAIKAFGNDAHIVLHGFGGFAQPDGASQRRWQRIVVSAAGPAIQLALWGALVAAIWADLLPRPYAFGRAWWLPAVTEEFRREGPTPGKVLMEMMLFANLFWPLLNLLPIWPLDGGQITREVFQGVSRERGAIAALWLSLLLSAALAVHSLLAANGMGLIPFLGGSMLTAIFFAMLAVGSYQAIQFEQANARGRWREDWPWDR